MQVIKTLKPKRFRATIFFFQSWLFLRSILSLSNISLSNTHLILLHILLWNNIHKFHSHICKTHNLKVLLYPPHIYIFVHGMLHNMKYRNVAINEHGLEANNILYILNISTKYLYFFFVSFCVSWVLSPNTLELMRTVGKDILIDVYVHGQLCLKLIHTYINFNLATSSKPNS